ncbi:hypothetical protein BHM03_00012651 [Ensete ventricosum]|nr:hypothetical protein BHM03_00012651 [Ensete ventricosum]
MRVPSGYIFVDLCFWLDLWISSCTGYLNLGYSTPFLSLGASHMYSSLAAAKAAVIAVGEEIATLGLPSGISPLVFVFTGDGNGNVIGTWTTLYWAVPSKIDRRRSIEGEIDCRRSIEGEKGKKKKKRKRRKKKKRRRRTYFPRNVLARALSPFAGHPRAIAALVRASPARYRGDLTKVILYFLGIKSVISDFMQANYYAHPDHYYPVFHEKIAPYASVIASLFLASELDLSPSPVNDSSGKKKFNILVSLSGHLFDQFLINEALDVIEAAGGSFHLVRCEVGQSAQSMSYSELEVS